MAYLGNMLTKYVLINTSDALDLLLASWFLLFVQINHDCWAVLHLQQDYYMQYLMIINRIWTKWKKHNSNATHACITHRAIVTRHIFSSPGFMLFRIKLSLKKINLGSAFLKYVTQFLIVIGLLECAVHCGKLVSQ